MASEVETLRGRVEGFKGWVKLIESSAGWAEKHPFCDRDGLLKNILTLARAALAGEETRQTEETAPEGRDATAMAQGPVLTTPPAVGREAGDSAAEGGAESTGGPRLNWGETEPRRWSHGWWLCDSHSQHRSWLEAAECMRKRGLKVVAAPAPEPAREARTCMMCGGPEHEPPVIVRGVKIYGCPKHAGDPIAFSGSMFRAPVDTGPREQDCGCGREETCPGNDELKKEPPNLNSPAPSSSELESAAAQAKAGAGDRKEEE